MRKLVFKFVSGEPKNSRKPKNIEIQTHRGSKIMLRSGIAVSMDVSDDPMSDNDLQAWYRTRYGSFGMGISVITDAPKALPVVPVETKTIDVKEVVKEEVPVAHVEAKVSAPKIDVNKMTYSELIQFCKDHDINVGGRAKELYLKAVRDWVKKHD